jgi:hypothetical protein
VARAQRWRRSVSLNSRQRCSHSRLHSAQLGSVPILGSSLYRRRETITSFSCDQRSPLLQPARTYSRPRLVGPETEAIYRRYAIADESMLREAAAKLSALHAAQREALRKVYFEGPLTRHAPPAGANSPRASTGQAHPMA